MKSWASDRRSAQRAARGRPFNTEGDVNRFLDDRTDRSQKRALGINPQNPLPAFFHQKPVTGPHTA